MKGEVIAVLGAGPAGLAAANELVERGARPLVLEKNLLVGGLARTEVYRGFSFDIGGHRFLTKSDRIDQLWRRMLGADFVKVPRLSRIYHRGRFFQYPLSVTNALSNLGLLESVLIVASYFEARVRPHPVEENFEQWVSNRFGKRLYEAFFRTYTEKVWGIPCTRIEADWAAQRIKGLSLAVAVSNALLGIRKAKSLIDEFDYPRNGPGMMWDRFRGAIEARGGTVLCGREALRLRHDSGRITRVEFREQGGLRELSPTHVISSVPLKRLVGLLEPSPPQQIAEAAARLTHRSFLMVGLLVKRERLFPDQWIYVHSADVRVGRVQNFKNWSAAMAPEPGLTNIGLEYFCDEGDELWSLPDQELGALAAQELGVLGLADAEDVVDCFVARQPDAYPVYEQGYKGHLRVIREYLARFENLQTIGRSGMHRYNNMDHSMLTGILAGQNVLGAHHDVWEVNEEEEYLERDRKAEVAPVVPEGVLTRAFARLDKLALATAVGTVLGLILFLATLWLVVKGDEVSRSSLSLLSQYFAGYTVSLRGSFIAFGYSFLWGFLLGWLFAYVRNLTMAFHVYRIKRRASSLSIAEFIDQI